MGKTKAQVLFLWICLAIVGVAVWVYKGIFIVLPSQQVLVMRVGTVHRVITDPGIYYHFKGMDKLALYPKQLLEADIEQAEMTLKDQGRVIVDVFARYTINDPELFYKSSFSVSDSNEAKLKFKELESSPSLTSNVIHNSRSFRSGRHNPERFAPTDAEYSAVPSLCRAAYRIRIAILSAVMNAFGKVDMETLLSDKRGDLEKEIKSEVLKQVANIGVDVMEVKVRNVSYPAHNAKAIALRMCTGPAREAKRLRGEAVRCYTEGVAAADAEAKKIKLDAKNASVEILRKARAEAEAKVIEAYSACPELAKLLLQDDSLAQLNPYDLNFVLTESDELSKMIG